MILLGSSRSQGNTFLIADKVAAGLDCEVIDISAYSIGYYDYSPNKEDDFVKFAERFTTTENLILATPIYWYTMSAQMKTLFDRLTDLITSKKSLGRKLAGKRMFLIITGSAAELPEGFLAPFKLTSEYLEMRFSGTLYCPFEADFVPSDDVQERIDDFISLVKRQS